MGRARGLARLAAHLFGGDFGASADVDEKQRRQRHPGPESQRVSSRDLPRSIDTGVLTGDPTNIKTSKEAGHPIMKGGVGGLTWTLLSSLNCWAVG